VPSPVEVLHYTDPACPWAYSAEPFLRALEWRYGDGLAWRHVMIGLTEDWRQYEARGYTPTKSALGYARFGRRFGMPVALDVRQRLHSSGRACRAVVAARAQGPELADALLRALRFGWFTTTLLMDEDESIRAIARSVEGLDVGAVLQGLDDPAVEDAYQRDREEARAALQPAILQGKPAHTDGPERFTAPSVVFQHGGRTLVAGGWQPLEAYDVCVANLAPDIERRAAPTAEQLLPAYPRGLTTQEVARVCTDGNDDVDRVAAETALLELVGRGRATRVPLGDDALWRPV
jgi:predicted DsbA family dithiol-disulfide isomerase